MYSLPIFGRATILRGVDPAVRPVLLRSERAPDPVSVPRSLTRRVARVGPWFHLEDVMATGTVKWFNSQKGYGFIQPEDGSKDVFVHISAVERSGMGNFHEGQKISYELERGQQGKTSAVNLQKA